MFAARFLLVAVAVLVTQTNAQNRCTSSSIGQRSSNPSYISEQRLSPGQADWDLEINSTCQTVGVDMTVCDTDVEPSVNLQPSMKEAWVHRNGQSLGVATVTTTVFCL